MRRTSCAVRNHLPEEEAPLNPADFLLATPREIEPPAAQPTFNPPQSYSVPSRPQFVEQRKPVAPPAAQVTPQAAQPAEARRPDPIPQPHPEVRRPDPVPQAAPAKRRDAQRHAEAGPGRSKQAGSYG